MLSHTYMWHPLTIYESLSINYYNTYYHRYSNYSTLNLSFYVCPQSESNVKELVVSHPDNGVNHFGLTDLGKQQAVEVSAGSVVPVRKGKIGMKRVSIHSPRWLMRCARSKKGVGQDCQMTNCWAHLHLSLFQHQGWWTVKMFLMRSQSRLENVLTDVLALRSLLIVFVGWILQGYLNEVIPCHSSLTCHADYGSPCPESGLPGPLLGLLFSPVLVPLDRFWLHRRCRILSPSTNTAPLVISARR